MLKGNNLKIIIATTTVLLLVVVISLLYINQNSKKPKEGSKPLPKIKSTEEVKKETKEFLEQNPDVAEQVGKGEPLTPDVQKIKEELIQPQNILENNNGDLLLVKTNDYLIQYITSPDIFIVTLLKEPVEENRKIAEKWFLDKGFSQENLCNLGLHFILHSSLTQEYKAKGFSSRPSGCN